MNDNKDFPIVNEAGNLQNNPNSVSATEVISGTSC